MEVKPVVEVSRPTHAELSSSLIKAGHADLLCDTGAICLGNLHLVSAQRASRVRLAAQIADASLPNTEGEPVYDDGHVRITTRCRENGIHLMVHNIHDATCATVVIPHRAAVVTAGEIIDCLSRDALPAR